MASPGALLPTLTPEQIEWGAERVCKTIKTSLANNEPFFIGRNGTVELETLFYWFTHRRGAGGGITQKPYPPRLLETMARNAGIWPATEESMDAWATAYSQALGDLHGLAAGWYPAFRDMEAILLQAYAKPTAFKTPLRSLEPYYVKPALRWTRQLEGKQVAVVTSFAESVAHQLRNTDAYGLWNSVPNPETLLPPFTEWIPVRTYYSPLLADPKSTTAWPSEHVRDWRDAVEWTTQRILATRASVVILGCGGLGMLVGARLRRAGVSAFVLGGATQVLFGIKGQRWATHPTIGKFWNSAWIWPSATETPDHAALIEGGCYWAPPGHARSSGSGRAPTPFPREN